MPIDASSALKAHVRRASAAEANHNRDNVSPSNVNHNAPLTPRGKPLHPLPEDRLIFLSSNPQIASGPSRRNLLSASFAPATVRSTHPAPAKPFGDEAGVDMVQSEEPAQGEEADPPPDPALLLAPGLGDAAPPATAAPPPGVSAPAPPETAVRWRSSSNRSKKAISQILRAIRTLPHTRATV